MLNELKIPRRNTTSINVFRGLNRSPNTGFSRVSSSSNSIYTEFKDLKNMSSDKFPQLSPRGNRSRIYCEDGIKIISNLLSANEGFIYVDSSKNLHIGSESIYIDSIDNLKKHSLVLFGNKIVVFPEKISINMSDKKISKIDVENNSKCNNSAQALADTYDYCYKCSICKCFYDAENKKIYSPAEVLYWSFDLTNDRYQLLTNHDMINIFSDINTVGTVIESKGEYYIVTGFEKNKSEYKDNRKIIFEKLKYQFNYLKINAQNIGLGLKTGDYIKISGMTESLTSADAETYVDIKSVISSLNGNTFKLYNVNKDSITIKIDLPTSVPYNAHVIVSRSSPEFDDGMIVEMENRLWCCSSKNNEIYCCKQADECNWQAYGDGISTDSWAMTCGKEGKFTGIATRGDSVIFFKENYVFKIYGTKPSNFTLGEYNVPGVKIGSEKSVVNINSTLFYHGHNGVYAYQSGSLPVLISEEALYGHTYQNAVGGRHGNKYYISIERDDGKQELLVYDTNKGLWEKEDDTKIIDCTTYNNVLYWLDEHKESIVCPDKSDNLVENTKYEYQREDAFEWLAETGDIYDSEFNVKNIGKLRIGIKTEIGSNVKLLVQYKDDGKWSEVGKMLCSKKKPRIFSVVLRRAEYLRLKLEGTGQVEIYGIDIEHSKGSDKRGSF